MKKTLLITLAMIFCLGLFAGCGANTTEGTTSATQKEKIINPLPETLDVKNLDNCTVAVSIKEGGAYVDDSGKMQMTVQVYAYELYDMVDIAELKEGNVIVRRGEYVKITAIERLDTGLVRINGGEEKGGFDLATDDETVYYEIGMNNLKNYYELGEVCLPVSDAFVYADKSDISGAEKQYAIDDFLAADIEYNFLPYNTSIVIENGEVIAMTKIYMP